MSQGGSGGRREGSPDPAEVDQQCMVLDGNGGAGLDDGQGGVDAPQVTWQQAVASQQVPPLDVQLVGLPRLIYPQHLQ